MKMLAPFVVAAAALIAGQAWAAPLTISKTAAVVSDPVNGILTPKVIPGAVVDYTILVQNPNTLTVTRAVVVTDRITDVAVPQGAEYFVGNLNGSNSGPVVFSDGSLLGLGLFSSNLTYTYSSLGSSSDNLAFSNDGGVTWTYTPVANSDGYDAAVTHIRVSPVGNFAVLSGFSLRLRVRVRQ